MTTTVNPTKQMLIRNSKQQLPRNEHSNRDQPRLKNNDEAEESRMNLLFLKDSKSHNVKATIIVDIS